MAEKYFKRLKQGAFYNFFENLDKKVTLNAATWQISAGDVSDMNSAFLTYKPLYQSTRNKKRRTSEQVGNHKEGRKAAERFIQEFANEILIPNASIVTTELSALGFNRTWNRKRSRPAINDVPFAMMEALLGSRIAFTVRTAEDSNRASIPPYADGVEVRYAIGTMPQSWKDCVHKEFSTRAKFFFELEPEDAGKKIYAYVRWKNLRHAEKSGPFGGMQQTMIRN
jgi:hypothetical protein